MVGRCPSRLYPQLFAWGFHDPPESVTPPGGFASRPATLRWLLFSPEHLHDLRELRGVLELPVDRGEPDVRHRIERAERLDHHLSHFCGRHFPLAAVIDPALDLIGDPLEG